MNPASRYQRIRVTDRVEETPLIVNTPEFSELELQARWFAGEFGRAFKTTDGCSVEIVQFGVWNREAGPDFAEAAISFDGAQPVRGCIELDVDIRDWERHGHIANPAYNQVILHLVFQRQEARYFTRTSENREVPQVHLDAISLMAKPSVPAEAQTFAIPGRCSAPFREESLEKIREFLESAAQFRLQKKSARLAKLREAHGADEGLFQAIAETLGYKENKLPFRLLAQRLPLAFLQKNKKETAALIFGVSGFLNEHDFRKADDGTRRYLRTLWDQWWTRRAELERLSLTLKAWKLSGARPANHPQRRVAALAEIARHWAGFRAIAHRADPEKIGKFFADLHDDYWDYHYTLTSKKSPTPMSLVGETRVAEILANVVFPLAISEKPECWNDYKKLSAPLVSRRVKIAATRLFGDPDLHRPLLRKTFAQQGLLQIYEDFCLQDASDCAQCPFPEQMLKWKQE